MNWLTADLPGTGGIYKEIPADFQVAEIPLYPCSGSGEHLYLWIEKEGISTRELLHQLGKGLELTEREIGYAGLKDARARTRQMISVPARCDALLDRLTLRQAKILQQNLHGNKLRLGHLAGNCFTIKLRNVHPAAKERALAIFKVLEQQGVPNRFGEQRYGLLGNTGKLGLLLLQENYSEFCRELLGNPAMIHDAQWRSAADSFRQNKLEECLKLLPTRMREEQRLVRDLLVGKTPKHAALALPRNLLRLYLSACQSHFFDQLLEQRLLNLGQLQNGDIAYKHENGACFRVEHAETEQSRSDRLEISPTAPLFGYKIMLAEGQAGEREQKLLAKTGISTERWKFAKGLEMSGERRPLHVPLNQPTVSDVENGEITLSFSLPKGSYATSVLLEIIK